MRALFLASMLVCLASCAGEGGEAKATFMFRLAVLVDGEGSIVSAPAAIDCGEKCEASFEKGTIVTLQARAADGFIFEKWLGHCTGTPGEIVDITLETDMQCTAKFVAAPDPNVEPPEERTLTLVVLGPGKVDVKDADDALVVSCQDETCETTFAVGAYVKLEAHALGGELIGFDGDCTVTEQTASSGVAETAMDIDRTCTASFFSSSDVTLPVRVLVSGGGRITSLPSGIDCDASAGAGCEHRYPYGTEVTLTAIDGNGSTFIEWGQDCAGVAGPGVLLNMEIGFACSAHFSADLVVSVIGQGRVTSPNNPSVNCAYTCHYATSDQAMQLTAEPDPGYAFVEWTGACASGDPTNPNTVLPADATECTARFERVPPTLTVILDGASGGGVVTSTGGEIDCPASACSAEIVHDPEILPDPGAWTCLSFLNGNNTGCQCGCGTLDPDCASAGSSACLLAGECETRDHIVEDRNWLCYAEPFGGVPSVTLTATPTAGFVFSSWSGGCSGTAPVIEVELETSVTCTATFSPE